MRHTCSLNFFITLGISDVFAGAKVANVLDAYAIQICAFDSSRNYLEVSANSDLAVGKCGEILCDLTEASRKVCFFL
jgi:hypothetical protein